MFPGKTKKIIKNVQNENDASNKRPKRVLDLRVAHQAKKTPVKKAVIKKTDTERVKRKLNPPQANRGQISARESNRIQFEDKVERYKRITMLGGVSLIMLLVVFAWLFNIKKVINAGAGKEDAGIASTDDITANLNKNLEEMKEDLESFREIRERLGGLKETIISATSTLATSTPATSTPAHLPEIMDGQAGGNASSSKELQGRVKGLGAEAEIAEKQLQGLEENLENNLNNTATSTKK